MDQLVVLQEIFESYMRGGYPRPIDANSIDGDCTQQIRRLLEVFQQGDIDEEVCLELMNCLSDLYEVKRLGDICRLAGLLGGAVRCYNKALSMTTDQHLKSILLNNLGQVHARQSYLGRAIHHYEKAAEGFSSMNDLGGLAHVLGNMGSAYRRSHEWDTAIDHCEKSLEIFREIGDESGTAQMTGALGQIYAERADPERALEYYEKSLEDFDRIGDQRRTAKMLNQLGQICVEMRRWNDAIDYYNRSIRLFGDLGQNKNVGQVLSNLGRLYLDRGDLMAARDLLERSLDKIPQNVHPARPNAVSWLAVTYTILGKALHDLALQQISKGENTEETANVLEKGSVCYSRASNCYAELINIPEIASPDQKMGVGVTKFLSYFVLLESERRDTEAVKIANEAISALKDVSASADSTGKRCIEVIQRCMWGMKECWQINLSKDEPWKLTEMLDDSIERLIDGALLLSESTETWPRNYCEACGYLCEALSTLAEAIEEFQGGDPSGALLEAASILRRAEQKFELVAPDLGMLNAFQIRVARQKAEWMAEMAERRSGGAALIEVYQSTLLLVGWVLINTALAGMERFDRIRTWDDSMNLIEDKIPERSHSKIYDAGKEGCLHLALLDSIKKRNLESTETWCPKEKTQYVLEDDERHSSASVDIAVPINKFPTRLPQEPSGHNEGFKEIVRIRAVLAIARIAEFVEGDLFRNAKSKSVNLEGLFTFPKIRSGISRAFRLFAAMVVLYLIIDFIHFLV